MKLMRAIRPIDVTQVFEWDDGRRRSVQDCLAAEEPLEMRVNGSPVNITMRTPGHDAELLAGFLFTEGVVQSKTQISGIRTVPRMKNVIDAELAGQFDGAAWRRNFSAGSSCGVCGKASIEAVRRRDIRRPAQQLRISSALLCQLPEKLRAEQAVFGWTGGLHAAGLFTAEGELVVLREDVGRHNAVDKVIGWSLLHHQPPLSEYVLVVSGRGGFEIVQKALAAGIPVVASVSAPSSLAVRLARQFGLSLIGFLRGRRFVVYSGIERLEEEEKDGNPKGHREIIAA
jgi:FdhD protein